MILVYQAYGREDILKQTLFSVTSLLAVVGENSPLRVLIYTDRKSMFTEFLGQHPRVEYREISQPDILKWRGAIDFVHRVKVEILREAAARGNGPLFYVDGDTYFKVDPTALFERVNDNVSLMHIAENKLDEGHDPLSRKVRKFVRKNKFMLAGRETQIPQDCVMWNAGAIGISQKNKDIFPLVLDLTDQMYAIYPKHIMEQLAFSFVLQGRTTVVAGDKEIYHYWNQKDEYQILIEKFLKENRDFASARTACAGIVWPEPPEPKVYRNIFQRLFSRA